MGKIIFVCIAVLSTLSALLPLIIYGITRKSQADYIKYLGLLMILSFGADSIAMYLGLVGIRSTIGAIAMQIYIFSAGILVGLIYKNLFPKKFEWLFNVIIILLTLTCCYILWNDQKGNNTMINIPQAVVFIIFSLVYFFRLMSKMPTIYINQLPMFWINTGFLIYYAGAFVVFIFSDYLVNVLKNNMLVYWSFHNCLNILSHILFAIGLWQARPKVKPV